MSSLHALLDSVVDYAGLFPPSRLEMDPAVRNYAAYRQGEHAWMLGPFVVPAARLDEWARAVHGVDPQGGPWPLSVLLGDDADRALDLLEGFRAPAPGAEVAAVEARPASPEEIAALRARVPPEVEVFCEVPPAEDPLPWIEAVAAANAAAKIRTGGVTPEMIPTVDQLARFLRRCAELGVPCKATAGLHHPLRGERALTYEADSPRAVQHGFLNVFVAGALLIHRGELSDAELRELLAEEDLSAFAFDEDGLAWRGHRLDLDSLAAARRSIRSFGSCSFTEPVDDLQRAELL